MMTYKWQLRKSSRKEICPQCGQRRFVPYVSAADGITLAGAEYGRCDREQSCGYHRYPNGEKVVDGEMPVIEPKEMLQYNGTIMPIHDGQFYQWLSQSVGETDAMVACMMYHVGSINGDVVWWQVDKDNIIRTGKVMKYLADGHRDKSAAHPVTWAHKHPKLKADFQGEELRQCLFGEHLLTINPDMPVCLVESEKTALYMSILEKDILWLATGGSQGIKSHDRLTPLFGRRVLLIPDNGQYWSWLRVASQYGWECLSLEDCEPQGCDILDVALDVINQYDEYSKPIIL